MITYYESDGRPFDLPLPYLFQYVIDIREVMTLDERMSSPFTYRKIVARHRADIADFLSTCDDVKIDDHVYDFVYVQSISDDWLVMAKLHGRMFYQGIIETHIVRSDSHVS